MNTLLGSLLNDRPHPDPLPQERENRSLSHKISRAKFCRTVFGRPAYGGERQTDLQTNRISRWMFPLPGGEGQGEGGRYN